MPHQKFARYYVNAYGIWEFVKEFITMTTVKNEERQHRVFRQRAKLITHIRNFLDVQEFIEVDTPVLYPFPEIAPMEQFRVFDPSSRRIYYMRVCPTEHLKRLMVAGFSKVYEFSRNFRPGNQSSKHSAEFTSLECSVIDADYRDMMNLTEAIVFEAVNTIKGEPFVSVDGKRFDVTPPWPRVSVKDAVLEAAGVDVLAIESVEELRPKLSEYEGSDNYTLDQAIDTLIEKTVLPLLPTPTFLTDYPYSLGGPALSSPDDRRVKQRSEAFIGTLEIANMSSHLNNLDELRAWHQRSLQTKRSSNTMDAVLDMPLLESLKGMPNSAVLGIGIDRLVMLSLDQANITDVILFPFAQLPS